MANPKDRNADRGTQSERPGLPSPPKDAAERPAPRDRKRLILHTGNGPTSKPDALEPRKQASNGAAAKGQQRLYADPDGRIRLSQPSKISQAKLATKVDASRDQLKRLLDVLDGLYGADAPNRAKQANMREVLLSEDDLALLKAVVGSALILHGRTSFPQNVGNLIKALLDFLIGLKPTIDQLGQTVASLGGLAAEFSKTILALKELYDIVAGGS